MISLPARARWLPTYFALAFAWGTIFAMSKVALDSFTPIGVTAGRLVLATTFLLMVSWITKTRLPPRRLWRPVFINAFVVATLPWFLLTGALGKISYSLTSILASAIPLFTLLIILVAFPEEKPTRQRIVGLCVGFVGVLVVVGVWQGIGSATFVGMAMCLVANFAWASSFPYSRRHLTGGPHASDLSPLSLATGTLIMASIQGLPLAFFFPLTTGPITPSAVTALVILGCVCSGGGYLLSFRLLSLADATTASTISYAVPAVALTIGVVFLNEHLTWNEPVGAVLILGGAALAQGLVRVRSREPDD